MNHEARIQALVVGAGPVGTPALSPGGGEGEEDAGFLGESQAGGGVHDVLRLTVIFFRPLTCTDWH